MERFVLKSKIHRATLTGTDLDYQGSVTIDENLLEKADILPGEQVHVVNINNGLVPAEKAKDLQPKIVFVDVQNKPEE